MIVILWAVQNRFICNKVKKQIVVFKIYIITEAKNNIVSTEVYVQPFMLIISFVSWDSK